MHLTSDVAFNKNIICCQTKYFLTNSYNLTTDRRTAATPAEAAQKSNHGRVMEAQVCVDIEANTEG